MRFKHVVVIDPAASEPERYAGEQLCHYLSRMLGREVQLRIAKRSGAGTIQVAAARRRTAVRVPVREEDETYTVDVRRDRVVLTGGSPRAALYAAYAFLEQLGCRWFAPKVAGYKGVGHEHVPRLKSLGVQPAKRTFTPSMLYRELLTEENRTHTPATFGPILDWMAKQHINILQHPIDYQHSGRNAWDDIREKVIAEVRKRGLILTVGGHGYENFLPPEVFFDEHPEWFGMVNGKRSRSTHTAFETANPAALRTFTKRVAAYLREHPEIDILSLWPPDRVTWSSSPEALKQGTPSRRQAIVTQAVSRELKRQKIKTRVYIVTYDQCERYPERFKLDDDVIVNVDFYFQNHEAPIFDKTAVFESSSLAALDEWTANHRGPLCYFFYHRRYYWQSRPVVHPTLLWADINYVHQRGIRGISGFVEPGDWLTYELQHYLFYKLAADATEDLRLLVADWCAQRFGAAGETMQRYIWTLEKLSFAMQHLHSADHPTVAQIAHATERYNECEKLLRSAARTRACNGRQREYLTRMRTGLTTVAMTIEIHEAQLARSRKRLDGVVGRYQRYVKRHRGKGLFVESFWMTQTLFDLMFARPMMTTAQKRQLTHDLEAMI